jgi:hypothetical protein
MPTERGGEERFESLCVSLLKFGFGYETYFVFTEIAIVGA